MSLRKISRPYLQLLWKRLRVFWHKKKSFWSVAVSRRYFGARLSLLEIYRLIINSLHMHTHVVCLGVARLCDVKLQNGGKGAKRHPLKSTFSSIVLHCIGYCIGYCIVLGIVLYLVLYCIGIILYWVLYCIVLYITTCFDFYQRSSQCTYKIFSKRIPTQNTQQFFQTWSRFPFYNNFEISVTWGLGGTR